MAFIGNSPTSQAFVTDQFNGTGSQTAFTMSVAPAGSTSMIVAVSGVLQDPSTYAVVGTTLNFSVAPPAGTGNISVRYLGIPATGVTTTAYRTATEFTATSGQTTFTPPSYTVGYLDVYRNGVLLGSADYTATNGTTVVLATGCVAGDLVETISFYVSSVLNAIPNTTGSISSSNLPAGLTITTPSISSPTITSQATFAAGTVSLPAITTTGDTNTGIFFSAADTIDFTEGGTAVGQFDSSANFKFNSGYGSVATAYGCRAWVNFNGTGTVAIRASGNVTSITDNGTGDYTVNFTTAMPDVNYVICGLGGETASGGNSLLQLYTPVAGSFRFTTRSSSANGFQDTVNCCVAVFR